MPIVVARQQLSPQSQAALQGEGNPAVVRAWGGRGEDADQVIVGVLDIDCVAPEGFDAADVVALERIVQRIAAACDWDV